MYQEWGGGELTESGSHSLHCGQGKEGVGRALGNSPCQQSGCGMGRCLAPMRQTGIGSA